MPGPIFQHEMTAAPRRMQLWIFRVLLSALLFLLMFLSYGSAISWRESGDFSIQSGARLTAAVYSSFAWLTLLGTLLLTPILTAGAIATERERRTIEYLFATHLSSREIILDKLLARLLRVGQVILATLPVMAIFGLLGGLPYDLILWHLGLLLTNATLAAAIAMVVSVHTPRARNALTHTLVAIAVWLIGVFPCWGLSAELGLMNYTLVYPFINAWLLMNPFYAMSMAGGFLTRNLGLGFDSQMMLSHMGAELLAAAILISYSIWRVRSLHLSTSGKPNAKQAPRLGYKSFQPGLRLMGARPAPYESAPLFWQARYCRHPRPWWKSRLLVPLARLAVLGFILVPLVTTFLDVAVNQPSYAYSMYSSQASTISGFASTLLLVLVALKGATRFPSEREQQTWLTLRSTPLTTKEIVHQSLAGVLWPYRHWIGLLVFLPLPGVLIEPMMLATALTFPVIFGLLLIASATIGLHIGAQQRSTVRASVITLIVMAILCGAYMIVLGPVMFSAEEGILLFLAPCLPYLLSIPYLLSEIDWFDLEAAVLIGGLATAVGIVGYTLLSIELTRATAAMLEKRDELL